ncbi:MAG: hypothetical protein OEV40_04700 [Acidimicrobiia bacterium]|nr:hypothetical protein [Acidimicrobiia bacterium]
MIAARLAAYLLAVVLVAAAVAKARRPAATATEFAELGLAWPGALARLVPLVELACAAALVATPAWGGVVSFALLAAFTAVLVTVVRSGRVVRCSCFGGVGSQPVSARSLARNAVLLALAALATLA